MNRYQSTGYVCPTAGLGFGFGFGIAIVVILVVLLFLLGMMWFLGTLL
ncbi:hypothetical protein AWH56_016210 [Anaerobacillus isosaccharinicus]|uniref:Uncharacterized protein n=1 Tax=Anaerobacillus isosaccharinicus TaxID=1532552 RepID=A0A7S7L4G2_9BACI|nr:hypothetical protein [Anaerobacillus isosaccharinicus]MBA5587555.1 hypothetical protein [Anaerobacillus isosaccharinicus]QOY34268.1 hypothetical protein AWH56_016210 [Anaerobacillus isosaccharinicus]